MKLSDLLEEKRKPLILMTDEDLLSAWHKLGHNSVTADMQRVPQYGPALIMRLPSCTVILEVQLTRGNFSKQIMVSTGHGVNAFPDDEDGYERAANLFYELVEQYKDLDT